MQDRQSFDVIVVGCGIAGAAAAVAAAQEGASVAVVERAAVGERGGNTRWTEAFMRMKNETEVSDDFADHFMANSGHHLDPGLIRHCADDYGSWPTIVKAHPFTDPEIVGTLISEAGNTLTWLKSFGIRFSDLPSYLITQSTTRICPVGGGLALIDALAGHAEAEGVRFFYETAAQRLSLNAAGDVDGLVVRGRDGRIETLSGKVVLACGGFEGNAEMQTQYLGDVARYIRPVARGGYYNRGEGIRMALAIGAASGGDFSDYHAEPIDPRSGLSEPIVFVFPYGILVDRTGRRFIDEASGTVDAIYENIARTIARLPGGIAYVITDARLDEVPNWRRTVRSDKEPFTAGSLEELASQLGLQADQLLRTVGDFNAATRAGDYRPLEKDGLSTQGLAPPKSNWALPIARPPFRAWPISSANCFTFGGLKINSRAEVLSSDGHPIGGLFAAGEITGLYHGRYTGATSVLRGAVFGRIAGREAAAATPPSSRPQDQSEQLP